MATEPWQLNHSLAQLQQHEPFLVIQRAFLGVIERPWRLPRGLRQGPGALPTAMAVLRRGEPQVAPQIELLGGDGLNDVAADHIDLARLGIDRGDYVAMGAADRARGSASAEFRADALAHHLFA